MYILNNNTQLTKYRFISIGSHERQHLLFSLVPLILCCAFKICVNPIIKINGIDYVF